MATESFDREYVLSLTEENIELFEKLNPIPEKKADKKEQKDIKFYTFGRIDGEFVFWEN